MATIAITATETGQTTLTKTYTLADADMDIMVQAYQQLANISINGVATRAQVFNYLVGTWAAGIQNRVQQFKTQPAVVPAPITIA